MRIPTHQCVKCGALWTLWPDDKGWSVYSRRCGPCCDNVAMGGQIKALPSFSGGVTLHPGVLSMMEFFSFDHLPAHLADASAPFAELAWIIANGPQNAETTVALRKLLEAKDCAVRAVLPART